MILRYFVVDPIYFNDHVMTLMPDNDNLLLDKFRNSLNCGITDDGRIIVLVCFEKPTLDAIYENTGQTELNQIVLDYFDVNGSFVGETIEEVIQMFPEMDIPITETIDDEIVTIDRLNRSSWYDGPRNND